MNNLDNMQKNLNLSEKEVEYIKRDPNNIDLNIYNIKNIHYLDQLFRLREQKDKKEYSLFPSEFRFQFNNAYLNVCLYKNVCVCHYSYKEKPSDYFKKILLRIVYLSNNKNIIIHYNKILSTKDKLLYKENIIQMLNLNIFKQKIQEFIIEDF